MQLDHWPSLYALLRSALFSGNEAVRHHMERLAEVLEGDQLAALRELLDRPPQTEPVPRVIPSKVEAKAREIYDGWKHQHGWVPWVDGGNSTKQSEARRLASSADSCGVHPSPADQPKGGA